MSTRSTLHQIIDTPEKAKLFMKMLKNEVYTDFERVDTMSSSTIKKEDKRIYEVWPLRIYDKKGNNLLSIKSEPEKVIYFKDSVIILDQLQDLLGKINL